MSDVKAAKTPIQRGIDSSVIAFIVKFKSDPNAVNEFVKSLPDNAQYDYVIEDDYRNRGFKPKWFLMPITKGKSIFLRGGKQLYIDNACKDCSIVYFCSYYDS